MSLSTHTGTGGDVGGNASSRVLSGNLAHTMGAMRGQAYDKSAVGIDTARGLLLDTTVPFRVSPTSTGGRNEMLSDDSSTSAANSPTASSSVAMPLRAAGNAAVPPVGVHRNGAPAPIRPTPRAAPADRARPDAGTDGRRSVEIVFLVFDGAARPEPTPTDVPGPERIPELAGWVPGVGNAPAPPPDPVSETVSPTAPTPEVEPPNAEPPKAVSPDRPETERPPETPRAGPQVEGSALSGLDSALMLTWLLGEPSGPPSR